MPSCVQCVERVVGVADYKVSATAGERLITYALGSCLGIAVYDPLAQVAGLLHVMLPSGVIDHAQMRACPAMFVDSGVPLLFKACYALGAQKSRMRIAVAGGAHAGASMHVDHLHIGEHNVRARDALLLRNGVVARARDLGGTQVSRTLCVDVASGEVTVRVNGVERRF